MQVELYCSTDDELAEMADGNVPIAEFLFDEEETQIECTSRCCMLPSQQRAS